MKNKVHWPLESDVLHAIDCFIVFDSKHTPQMICIAELFESETLPIPTAEEEK